ncbi:hypothetical protein IAU60_000027 [Kwoniella sp. DSM 27419]
MFGPSPLNPNVHPFTDLYHYPGHSYSPLNYLPVSSRVGGPSSKLLVFYGLETARGDLRLSITLLEYQEGDGRIDDMRRCLYPGAVVSLPLHYYKVHHAAPMPFCGSLGGRLCGDILVSTMRAKYSAPPSKTRRSRSSSYDTGSDNTHTETEHDDPEATQDTSVDQPGWWRTNKDWGNIVKGTRKDDFEAVIQDMIHDYQAFMEQR